MLKIGRFSRVFAEYLKNLSTDFYQTSVIFRQLSTVSFEIKEELKIEDRSFLVAMV